MVHATLDSTLKHWVQELRIHCNHEAGTQNVRIGEITNPGFGRNLAPVLQQRKMVKEYLQMKPYFESPDH